MDLSRHINAISIGVMLIPLKIERSLLVVAILITASPVLAFSVLVMGTVISITVLALGH
jgi:hypothetical protein